MDYISLSIWPPPENVSVANDVIPMPCACFAVLSDFSRQNCPLLWSVIAAVWRVFIPRKKSFNQPPNVVKGVEIE